MNKKARHDYGGPAFPRPPGIEYEDSNCTHSEGMSLRDWFAGPVLANSFLLQQYCTNPDGIQKSYGPDIALEGFAEDCYELADAMLAEREK